MSDILLSIILTSYNRARTVSQAIASIGAHPSLAWELIVVDDGSTDDSVAEIKKGFAALKRPDDSFCTLIQQSNRGVALARNHAVAHARGQYIVSLDSDDLWAPHTLETLLRELPKQSYASLFFLQTQDFQGQAPAVLDPDGTDMTPTSFPTFCQAAFSTRKSRFAGSNFAMPRQVFEVLGGFDPEFLCAEDTDLFLRAGADAPVVMFKGSVLVWHRIGEEGSLSADTTKVMAGLDRMLEREAGQTYGLQDKARERRNFFAGSMVSAVRIAFAQGQIRQAYKLLMRFSPWLMSSHQRRWVWRLWLLPVLHYIKPSSFAFRWRPNI